MRTIYAPYATKCAKVLELFEKLVCQIRLEYPVIYEYILRVY